jgi:uncharacterized membrane protein
MGGRLLRHLFTPPGGVARAFPGAAMAAIQAAITESEKGHGGEIRFAVEPALDPLELLRGLSARDRALQVFADLRVWDTEHNNGVLIYLLLAEHAIEIVADRGLNAHVSHDDWARVVAGMRDAFRARRYEEGLNAAIDAVDVVLARHFPIDAAAVNPNELPDAPHVG